MRPGPCGGVRAAACLLTLVCGLRPLAVLAARLGGGGTGGSSETVADKYPFTTLVVSKDTPLCTGALVAPRVVLTTAACVAGEQEPQLVYIGASNFFLDPFRRPDAYELLDVDRVVVHPGYSASEPSSNNLALLVLKKASSKEPAALPGAEFAYPSQPATATVLGFGSLNGDGFWPQLHQDKLKLLPQEECSGLLQAYDAATGDGDHTQACTELSFSFRACAAGNIGAPLLLPAPDGASMVQVGLLNSAFACSPDPAVPSSSSPALYIWLPEYADWLESELAGFD